MTSLNPISQIAADLTAYAVPLRQAMPVAGDGTNFLSFLQQTSDGREPSDLRADKQGDPLSFAMLGVNIAVPANGANVPLPMKLSLHLFGPKVEAKGARDAEPKQQESDQSGQDTAATTLPWTVLMPGAMAPPQPARDADPAAPRILSGKAAGTEAEFTPVNQGNPRLDADTSSPIAPLPRLAFALRLTPADDQPAQPPIDPSQTAVSEAGRMRSVSTPAAPVSTQAIAGDSTDPHTNDQRVGPDGMPAEASVPAVASGTRPEAKDAGADTNQSSQRDTSRQHDGGGSQIALVPSAASTPIVSSLDSNASAPDTTTGAAHIATAAEADVTAKPGPISELAFSVSGSDQQKVQVHVSDRGGEVRISVRTPDESLAGTLRQDLGTLTTRLNQSGYGAETFAPASHGGQLPQEHQDTPNQHPGGGQDRSNPREGQQNQQHERGKRPAWLDELENSLADAPARKV